MAKPTGLAERQRRALDQLKPPPIRSDCTSLEAQPWLGICTTVSRHLELFSWEPDLDLAAVHAAMTHCRR